MLKYVEHELATWEAANTLVTQSQSLGELWPKRSGHTGFGHRNTFCFKVAKTRSKFETIITWPSHDAS